MISYRLSKKEYKKFANQLFFQESRALVTVLVLGSIACLYGLIAELSGETGYFIWVIPTAIICLIILVSLISTYIVTLSKFCKHDDNEFRLTYSTEELCLCNETTASVYNLKLNEVNLKKKTKSFLMFYIHTEVRLLLIVPRNNTTQEFEALFSPEEKR